MMRPTVALPPVMLVWVDTGRSWWIARAARERALLSGLAVVFAVFIAVTLVWNPIRAAREAAKADIRIYDALAMRLAAAGPNLSTARAVARGGSPQATVANMAGESALQISQIEQQGARTEVTLAAADFVRLVQWLDRLEREAGLTVADIELERLTVPGTVDARISLVRR